MDGLLDGRKIEELDERVHVVKVHLPDEQYLGGHGVGAIKCLGKLGVAKHEAQMTERRSTGFSAGI